MGFMFLIFVVIVCWILYLIVQWTKSVNPSKDGTMLYISQKADYGVPKSSSVVDETQVEKTVEEELEAEVEELEVDKFKTDIGKVDKDGLECDLKTEVEKVIAEIELKTDSEMDQVETSESKVDKLGTEIVETCVEKEIAKVDESERDLKTQVEKVIAEIELKADSEMNTVETSKVEVGKIGVDNVETDVVETDVEKVTSEVELLAVEEVDKMKTTEVETESVVDKLESGVVEIMVEKEIDEVELEVGVDIEKITSAKVEVEKVDIDKVEKAIMEVEVETGVKIENIKTTEVEKEEERKVNEEEVVDNSRIEENIDKYFLSYDEEVSEDEFDFRVAEILIKANEMDIAQESICEEIKKESTPSGENIKVSERSEKDLPSSKQTPVGEDLKFEVEFQDKENFVSKEDKEDSFVQILKDLDEAETVKGIKEAIKLFEEEACITSEGSNDEVKITKTSEEQSNASKEIKIEEQNYTGTEDSSVMKEARKKILDDTNIIKEVITEVLRDTNVEDEVSKENKQESTVTKYFKETGITEADKDTTTLLKVYQTEPIEENEDKDDNKTENFEKGQKENEDFKSKDKQDESVKETFLEESEKFKKETEELENKVDTTVLEGHKGGTEILQENKDKFRESTLTEKSTEKTAVTTTENDVTNISEQSVELSHKVDLGNEREKEQQKYESTCTGESSGEEVKTLEEEGEEIKILKDLNETETSESQKETSIFEEKKFETKKQKEKETHITKEKGKTNNRRTTIVTDSQIENEKFRENDKSKSLEQELLSKLKEMHTIDLKDPKSGNKNVSFTSQENFRSSHSSETENTDNTNKVNKTVIITHEGDFVSNYNEEIQISEVMETELVHQQKIEYIEIAGEEEVLYRNVTKRGEEEFVEEFQTKNEIFNEKSCTSSVVTNEEVSSNQQTTSTTVTKVINLSYTAEECSTENIEIRTIIGDKEVFLPLTDNEQYIKLDTEPIKDRIILSNAGNVNQSVTDGSLKENFNTLEPASVENVSNDGVKEFKKPVGGVLLFGGEELLNKIKSRKLIVDGYEKEQQQKLENGDEWRLSKINKDIDECQLNTVTSKSTSSTTSSSSSSSSSTTTKLTSQMMNQKTQMKQDVRQINLSSNAFEKPDVEIPALSANLSHPTNNEGSSATHFSESHFGDDFKMTSHNGSEGEIISEIPTFQTESPLIHLNKDRNKGPVRRRKPEKSNEGI